MTQGQEWNAAEEKAQEDVGRRGLDEHRWSVLLEKCSLYS